MKRALAERAKQSGLPNGVAPASPAPEKSITALPESSSSEVPPSSFTTAPHSLSSASPRSIKIARNESFSLAPSPRISSSSPRPKKRLRESVVKLEEEDEDDSNASAFYLRHQNRALASELRTLKYELTRLEREREYRRAQCTKAVQSLNALQATWTQMEAALQYGQPMSPPVGNYDYTAPSSGGPSNMPLSTGSGKSVELVSALLDSLAALGSTTESGRRIKSDGDEDDMDSVGCSDDENANGTAADCLDFFNDGTDKQHLDDLLRVTNNVARRANTLQGWIFSLLRRVEGTEPNSVFSQEVSQAQEKIARLKAKNKTLKAQIKEIARSRDEMSASDKRVRRGLYRLAAGHVNLKEVLKAIATSDEDKETAAAWMEVAPPPPVIVSTANTINNQDSTVKSESIENDGKVDPGEVAQLKKQISDLEQVAAARDEQIKKLLAEREEQMKKINSLVLMEDDKPTNITTDEDVKRTDLYAEMSSKLASCERKIQEMEERERRIKEEWSTALSNAEAAREAMEDMQSKHMKRWAELAEEYPDINGKESHSRNISKAEEIVTLQHKLTQSLENVRQAEITRKTLEEAVSMNESLQAKLEEIKAKYTALQQGRASSGGGSSSNNNSSTAPGGVTTPKPKSSSSSGTTPSSERSEKPEKSDKSEKLHREYRRLRKELAALTASKEAAKSKLERTEKERDSLNQSNSRLLKQAAEKDEMNAKSLSTILHLKQLADQITKEKENLEQQVKSAQQLALAARLAANARERLSEEFEKERKGMESRVKEREEKYEQLAKEKEVVEGKLAQLKAQMVVLMKDAEKAKGRCEELASESTTLQEEKQRMMEALAVAQKEAAEATKYTDQLIKQSGGSAVPSGFTVEQLSTQVNVLKDKLACPVCKDRDKKCIILRCRHMFCKQCVDENIKNRSRKCPACGTRFDTKEVADVWL